MQKVACSENRIIGVSSFFTTISFGYQKYFLNLHSQKIKSLNLQKMYAIVEIAGQQFKVQKNDEIFVHRMDKEPGTQVEF